MKLYYETTFEYFAYYKCWSGARDTVAELTADEIRYLDPIIEEIFEGEMAEGELNDFLWFERDTIAEWLGFKDFDDLMEKHKEAESEEDE